MKNITVLSVFGTRPEAIKMCPLVKKMRSYPQVRNVVCVTGQHREMLKQVLDIFQIVPEYDLDLMQNRQTLTSITTRILEGMIPVFEEVKPDIVLVHGDTTTSFAVALAAFYQKIPVGHVEAGLRTFDKYSPYPEEMNRCLTGRIAELHFSPTKCNQMNLLNEGIDKNVYITGNTVIDSFATTVKQDYEFKSNCLKQIDFEKHKVVLMTAHRRENLGQPLLDICNAVKKVIEENKDMQLIYPVHYNPAVRETVFDVLGDTERIHLIDPIDVEDMHNIMSKSFLVLTDSGGLQEEAPSFGVPVVVLRTETERPEAVEAGTVVVVGVNEESIYKTVMELIQNQETYVGMARAINPYGDGRASERITEAIMEWGIGKGII